ncbi:unnamed protein product [Calicophoron daubneyi]|uniref:Biogenesis of lysosome-related organelles complex 1 subunit 1 n=1 Tax=Calicophoron daubneyi TaxID=300641 RepID=A0AAV2TUN9_CALDB
MLGAILKEHQASRDCRKALVSRKKHAMSKAMDELVVTLFQKIDDNVEKAYNNQRRLNAEIKKLHEKTQVYKRQLEGWLKLADELSKTLKELGDVENWASRMERDAFLLDGCLRLFLTHGSSNQATSGRKETFVSQDAPLIR